MMRVLLVEDDLLLGETIKEFLEDSGISVTLIQDDRNLTYENPESYDVLVLDLMLKFFKGEDLILDIRKKSTIPILILTAKRELKDKEVCFERGADDYLTKPFEPKELLLRLKVLSRRRLDSKLLKSGKIVVDLDFETVFVDGKELRLSATAWKLLSFLIKHRGEIVPKERIMGYVWGNKPVGEVLRTYIKERNVKEFLRLLLLVLTHKLGNLLAIQRLNIDMIESSCGKSDALERLKRGYSLLESDFYFVLDSVKEIGKERAIENVNLKEVTEQVFSQISSLNLLLSG